MEALSPQVLEESPLWSELEGGLWHSTSFKSFLEIYANGFILPNFGGRYSGAFSRSLRGVSLFDFGPSAEFLSNQRHNWMGWFGHEQASQLSVWVEIRRDEVESHLLDARAARMEWDKNPSWTFIPGVEAVHKGAIPLKNLGRALLVFGKSSWEFETIEIGHHH